MNLTGKAETVEIDEVAMKALQLRYPAVAVHDELCKMHMWLIRYEKRRPVRIWVFIDKWLQRAPAVHRPQTVVQAWWATEERTINQGAAIGLTPRPGETMAAFRDRVGNKMRAA